MDEPSARVVSEVMARVVDTELADLPSVMLAALADAIPVHMAGYYELDRDLPELRLTVHPPEFEYPDHIVRRSAEIEGEHPIGAYNSATGDDSAMRISDLISQEEYHELIWYREVNLPLGIEYQIAFRLPGPDRLVVVVALARSDRDFTDDERDLCNLLRLPLAAVLRSATRTALVHEALIGQVADTSRCTLIACDEDGLLPLDSSGDSLVARLTDDTGHLAEPLSGWLSAVRTGRSVLADPDPDRYLTTWTDSTGDLELRYVPGQDDRDLVVVRELSLETLAVLRSLGLRPREADVLELVMDACDNAEIARTLGISVATVKKHLEGIYRSLAVSSRTAAAAAGFRALTEETVLPATGTDAVG